MRKWLITVLLVAPAVGFGQSVFKCPGPNGQTVFQQHPCSGGTAVPVTTGNVVQGERVPAPASRNSEDIGLNDQQLRARYGNPVTINTDIFEGYKREQYVFRGPNGSTYVYLRDGRSYAVQHRPAVNSVSVPDERCYSDRDIWNAGVGINSQSLPPVERARRQREVDRMTARKCGR